MGRGLAAAAVAAIGALGAGCELTRAPEIPEAREFEEIKRSGKTYHAFVRAFHEGERAWNARDEDRSNVRRAIDAWERAYAIDPHERQVLQRLTMAYYYQAYYFEEGEERRAATFRRAQDYGTLAARLNPEVRRAMDAEGKTLDEAIRAHAVAGDVPGIFWMASSWGRAIENESIAVRAVNAPKLRAIMETVYRLGPTYYWGGVHRFFGVYYLKAPAQKDPLGQSKREFEEAGRYPQNLENKVLYAEYAAKADNDRALYERLLREVLESDPARDLPYLRLDNRRARERARKMLETIDEDF